MDMIDDCDVGYDIDIATIQKRLFMILRHIGQGTLTSLPDRK
jgi:hypothetical protein